jgi:hypothetical protein
MRVLVIGRNAKVVATAAGAFAYDLQIQTATTKAASLALLERTEFDLIVACETLGDGSGLEVLSHVAINAPNTLRIFAARPSTLNLLKGELGLFGLFRTLPYPINFPKLWAAINLARSPCADLRPARAGNAVKHVVLEDGWKPAPQVVAACAKAQQPARLPDTSGIRAAARYAAAHAQPPAQHRAVAAPVRAPAQAERPAASAGTPVCIPQSEAFKRALAKRNAARLEANSQLGSTDHIHTTSQILGVPRHEPGITNESLAQLAKLAITSRSAYRFRGAPGGKKRAALFVGSGLFAATTAAVLSFFMMNANNSMDRSKLPLIASINRPGPNKAFPWQPQAQQPTRPTALPRSESSAPAAADLEVEAEAASENFEVEPGHPGPPQPNPPPPSSEPPSLESPAEPIDE